MQNENSMRSGTQKQDRREEKKKEEKKQQQHRITAQDSTISTQRAWARHSTAQ